MKPWQYVSCALFIVLAVSYAQPAAAADANLSVHIPQKMIAGQTYQGVVVADEPAPIFGDNTVHLASGTAGSIILPAGSVKMHAGGNHAIFDIVAVGTGGAAELHAIYGGMTAQAAGHVYSASTGPHMLRLYLPSHTTSADAMMGVIMLLDRNGYPAKAVQDTLVRVVADGLLDVDDDHVTIERGKTHAALHVHVGGSGHIAVAGAGLEGDGRHVRFVHDAITLHIAVAPGVALPGGTLKYAAWLERDGRPYEPPRTMGGVTLQTSDVGILRFTEQMPTNLDHSTHDAVMRGGQITGTAYAGHAGHAEITVSIPEYGTASALVCVGRVILGGGADDNGAGREEDAAQGAAKSHAGGKNNPPDDDRGTVCIGTGPAAGAYEARAADGQRQMRQLLLHTYGFSNAEVADVLNSSRTRGAADSKSSSEHNDHIQSDAVSVWALPPVTGPGQVTGVVGFYRTQADTIITAHADPENATATITKSQTYKMITPARAVYEHVTVTGSPQGLHFEERHVAHPTHHTNAYDFEVWADTEGVYTIGASSRGYSGAAQLEVVAPYDTTYMLRVVPLPVAADLPPGGASAGGKGGSAKPLFLVSITDGQDDPGHVPDGNASAAMGGRGKMLDVHREFGMDRVARAVMGDGSVYEARLGSHNSAVIYGDLPGDAAADAAAGATLTLEGVPGAARPVSAPYNLVGVPVSISVDMPPLVRSGEEFPIALHTVDSFGIPVERLDALPDSKHHGGPGLPGAGVVSGLDHIRKSGTAAGGMLGVVHAALESKDGDVSDLGGNRTFEIHPVSVLHALGGGARATVTSFLNEVDFGYDAPQTVSAGEPFSITMESDQHGITYEISESPWQHEQTAPGVFVITPDTQGDATITVSGRADGSVAKTIRIPATALMSVPVLVSAVAVQAYDAQGGGRITGEMAADFEMSIDAGDGDAVIHAAVTPYTGVITRPSAVTIEFPEGRDGGYGLAGISVEGGLLLQQPGENSRKVEVHVGDSDIMVQAQYEQRVHVGVAGGAGTGIYPYGAPVLVAADAPADRVPVLIPGRFAHWDGTNVPAQWRTAESFVADATRNIDIYPVYEPDYTRVMYVVAACAAVGAAAAWRIAAGGRHVISGVSYRVRGMLNDMRGSTGDDMTVGGYEYGHGGGGSRTDDDDGRNSGPDAPKGGRMQQQIMPPLQ